VSFEDNEEKVIEVASFLENIYEIDFFEAYKFAKHHVGKSLEDICQIYFDNENKVVAP